jgi:hypothetical protein
MKNPKKTQLLSTEPDVSCSSAGRPARHFYRDDPGQTPESLLMISTGIVQNPVDKRQHRNRYSCKYSVMYQFALDQGATNSIEPRLARWLVALPGRRRSMLSCDPVPRRT